MKLIGQWLYAFAGAFLMLKFLGANEGDVIPFSIMAALMAITLRSIVIDAHKKKDHEDPDKNSQ